MTSKMDKKKAAKLIGKIHKIKRLLNRHLILSYLTNKSFDKKHLQSNLIGGE